MTPGCDSREDNNFSSDAEVPTLPAKTLPLSRSRSLKRDIVGTHQIFVFYSLGDVRDGFARDCPLRHPVAVMLALRDRSRPTPRFALKFRRFQGISGGCRRSRGAAAARGRRCTQIVSRARCRGPGSSGVRASRPCRRRTSHLSRVIPGFKTFDRRQRRPDRAKVSSSEVCEPSAAEPSEPPQL